MEYQENRRLHLQHRPCRWSA